MKGRSIRMWRLPEGPGVEPAAIIKERVNFGGKWHENRVYLTLREVVRLTKLFPVEDK